MQSLFFKLTSCFFLCSYLMISLASAEVEEDSTNFANTISKLQNNRQFATAHILLENRIKAEGIRPNLVFSLFDNCMNNYFNHQNFAHFYLQDHKALKKSVLDTSLRVHIVRVRHPERLLQVVIRNDELNSEAYKKLGDFFNIQLESLKKIDALIANRINIVEQKVLDNYEKAASLGYNEKDVNSWLGSYYYRTRNMKNAESFFSKNLNESPPDPVSCFKMAEISFEKKQYTDSYDFVIKSITNFSAQDIYLKYEALRLAAKILLNLGDLQKYHLYIHESIDLLPDEQAAYLDLISYYLKDNQFQNAEATYAKLLEENAFEESGFRSLEKYVSSQERYYFADSLMDVLLQQYENWDEAMANIYWTKGNLAQVQGFKDEATKYWDFSRNFMRRYLPENHSKIYQVGKTDQ